MDLQNYKPKSFWERPEGTTGMVFVAGLIAAVGYFLYKILPFINTILENTIYTVGLIAVLVSMIYMIIDPKVRTLVSYMYQSVMRWITGVFVQIDPIGILENYIDDLKKSLRKMNQQIGNLRGQMQKLAMIIQDNQRQISQNLQIADAAKRNDKQAIMVLKSRAAGRLQDSNLRLEDLYKKMEVLHRVLVKMYENSEIMSLDLEDQVKVKKQERSAIQASHSAMSSAMSILNGNPDKKRMFDMAMEAVNDDVSQKIGEMQRFMDLSGNFMNSIDLQNGIFEEEGLKMLEKWEKEGISKILGDDKNVIINQSNRQSIDLNGPTPLIRDNNSYNDFFNT
ncbi:MAG: hypothetical protein RI894_239 [Bacteroidota bacterium]|jgi:phage shock protein A